MSYINDELKSLFIHVPKCGGSSMESFKWNNGNGHFTILDFERINKDEYFKWCFVRNPFDRIASAYITCPELKISSFLEFLQTIKQNRPKNFGNLIQWNQCQSLGLNVSRIHFYPMTSLVSVKNMDFIGRFENIEEDWKIVSDKFGETSQLPNRRKRTIDLPAYNKKSRELVREIYASDFIEFGYDD